MGSRPWLDLIDAMIASVDESVAKDELTDIDRVKLGAGPAAMECRRSGSMSGMPSLTGPLIERGVLASRPQPELRTEDLLVRPWRSADAPAIVAGYADPAIQQWHVRTVTPEEAAAMVEASHRDWPAESRIDWAVADADGRVLGRVALNHLDLYEGVAEFAYWTLPSARGRGTAVRAVSAVSNWAFGVGFHRLTLRHSVHNEASCRVAGKTGFGYEGTQRQAGRHADGWHDMHLHARLVSDVMG